MLTAQRGREFQAGGEIGFNVHIAGNAVAALAGRRRPAGSRGSLAAGVAAEADAVGVVVGASSPAKIW